MQIEKRQPFLDVGGYKPLVNKDMLSRPEIRELIGVCKGVTADSLINLREAKVLLECVTKINIFKAEWHKREFISRIKRFISSEHISNDEHKQLYDLINYAFQLDGTIYDLTEDERIMYTNPVPQNITDGFLVCLSGTFMYGIQRECCKIVTKMGGYCTVDNISGKVDCVVIGSLATHGFKFDTFGRKVEAANKKRKSGNPIIIVREKDLIKRFRKEFNPI